LSPKITLKWNFIGQAVALTCVGEKYKVY